MDKSKYTYAQLGMLFGLAVGGGLATILFTTTGNAVFFALAGVGFAVGLLLGAGFDKRKQSD